MREVIDPRMPALHEVSESLPTDDTVTVVFTTPASPDTVKPLMTGFVAEGGAVRLRFGDVNSYCAHALPASPKEREVMTSDARKRRIGECIRKHSQPMIVGIWMQGVDACENRV